MTEITFTLPRPPSVNALYANVQGRGRVKTARYRTWIVGADATLMEAGVKLRPMPDGPVAVTYEVAQPDARKRDLDNLGKSLGDYLTSRGVIADDSLIDALHVYRVRHADWDGVRVTVRSLATVSEAAE
jgi:Holliday junction resolvase RusA-like endonuclease